MNNLGRAPSKILTRDAAYKLLFPYTEDFFLPALQSGLNDFCSSIAPGVRSRLSKRSLASVLNDLVVDEAIKRFDGEKGVRINEDRGFKAFIFDERAAVRIKKVDKHYRYSNYPTAQQLDILYQKEINGFESATYVILGYSLSDDWRDVDEVSLCCWYGQSRRWEIPVAGEMTGYLFDPSGQAATTIQKPTVRPKQTKRMGANA